MNFQDGLSFVITDLFFLLIFWLKLCHGKINVEPKQPPQFLPIEQNKAREKVEKKKFISSN